MKTLPTTAAAILALSGTAAFADGDAAKGEKEFKKCKSCHEITSPDGEKIVKGGKTGPNLWGVVGRQAGTEPDFEGKYSEVMVEAGEAGLVWDEEALVEYLPDPTAYLEEVSGDDSGKSKMTFKLNKGAEDVAAYLATLGPEADS